MIPVPALVLALGFSAAEPVRTLLPQDAAPAPQSPDLPVGREAVEALRFSPLEFEPPNAGEHEVSGVPVFHLYDPALPLVDIQLLLRGGTTNFPRDRLGTLSALPFVLRNGGTVALPPDSVDRRVDLLALQLSVGRSGGGTSVSMNALTDRVDPGLDLLRQMLLEPRFDSQALEVWRGRELENLRRRDDNPTGLAFSEFNRLMYGDHPVGWVTTEDDLSREQVSVASLRDAHEELFCRERLIVGISGDLTWDEAAPRVRALLEGWPECDVELAEPDPAEVRDGRSVFVLPRDLDQTTVVVAGPSHVRQEDSPEYFASRVANYLLGGRGFSSRLLSRLRTDEGLTYGAASVWTTPRRSEGIVGAYSSTRGDRTLEMTRLLLEVLSDFRDQPPDRSEVNEAVEEIARGYVFAFESASQIVARRMSYRAQRLPDGWLERYLEGLQEVTAASVRAALEEHLAPEEMTILLVGDPDRFESGWTELGPTFRLTTEGEAEPWSIPEAEPDGSPRSPP